ncbi:hypothetical protein P7I89_10645 [Pseudomonas aeruginosa]|nr:hypothetical protein P7I89_10645 [Pseudomonas aeruginosa]
MKPDYQPWEAKLGSASPTSLSIVPIAVFRRLGADARPRRHDDPPRPGDEAAFVFMQFAYTPARREKTGACAISATSTHIPAAASYTASKPRAAPDDRASGTAKTKDS